MSQKKRDRSTKKQLYALVAYIENNKEMVYPPNEATKYKEFEAKWEELTTHLNDLDGPQKTTKQWKSVFTDLKSNAKKKQRQINIEQTQTGGGPSSGKKLSELDERIIQLIEVVIEGVPIPESGLYDEILIINPPSELTDLDSENKENINSESGSPQATCSPKENVEPTTRVQTSARKRPIRRKPFLGSQDVLFRQLIASNYVIARGLNNIAKALKRGNNL